jgi:hypothetical protein
MTETVRISRRSAFWILASGAAIGIGIPAAVVTAPDAEAQTYGMERRQNRRDNRHDRRDARRDNRQDRRGARQDNRQDRRDDRRGTVGSGTAGSGGNQ